MWPKLEGFCVVLERCLVWILTEHWLSWVFRTSPQALWTNSGTLLEIACCSVLRYLQLTKFYNSTFCCRIDQLLYRRETAKIIFSYPNDPRTVKMKTKWNSWMRTEITSLLPIARQKFPAIFRGVFGIFRCTSILLFLSRFLADTLQRLVEPCFVKHCYIPLSCWYRRDPRRCDRLVVSETSVKVPIQAA
jgi:hypothetical protein